MGNFGAYKAIYVVASQTMMRVFSDSQYLGDSGRKIAMTNTNGSPRAVMA